MTANSNEAAAQERLKVLEHVALRPAHDVDKFHRELEGRFLKLEVSGGGVEDEAVIDVNDIAVAGHHDVAIVAVLDLEEIAHQGVRRE